MKFEATFDQKVLGVACDITVSVDVNSGEVESIITMRSMLRAMPAFQIKLSELAAIAEEIQIACDRAKLLDLFEDADDKRLVFRAGGAMLTVFQNKANAPYFVLSIGSYNREGKLADLNNQDLQAAVTSIMALQNTVQAKVKANKAK